MGLRIIYGKAGSGKTQYCFSEIETLQNKEKNIYIIVPDVYIQSTEIKLVNQMKNNAVINTEILSFKKLANKFMQENGKFYGELLNESTKSMLMYSILCNKKDELFLLGKSTENVDLANNIISQLRKNDISLEKIKQEMQNIKDEYLKRKINDICIIYEEFEKRTKDKYYEDIDVLKYLKEKIKNINFLQNSYIYIDEFSEFSKQEQDIIVELEKIAKQVNITICTDNLEGETNPDVDIFYSNKREIFKIIEKSKQNNIELEQPIFLSEQKKFKNEEIKHVEKNICSSQVQEYDKNVENVKMFLAKNQYSEVEYVAEQIDKCIRENKNIRYGDIGIITTSLQTYYGLINAIFSKKNIPIIMDKKKDIEQNTIIQYVLTILEILDSNFLKESIFNYLKLGFIDIEVDDIFELENYALKWDIKGDKWKKDFAFGFIEETNKKVEYLNELRRNIVNPLVELNEKITTAQSATRALYEFLQEQNIEKKINEKVKFLKQVKNEELADEYIETYRMVLDLFDNIVKIYGGENVDIKKYRKIVNLAFEKLNFGKAERKQDRVVIGNLEKIKANKTKIVFVLGLNDGSFPTVNKVEGFFTDTDKEKLKNLGIDIGKTTIEQLYVENFNVYKTFSAPENMLFTTYVSSDFEGKPLRQSMIVNKIKNMFPLLKVESNVLEKDRKSKGKFKLNKEFISEENAKKLYGNDLKTSISKLERFAQCPFSYYMQYGLKLKEKQELKIQSFDTGSFLHEVIDEFFKIVKKENLDLSGFLEDNLMLEKSVENIILKIEPEKKYTFAQTVQYNILLKRLKKIIINSLKYIITGLVGSEFEISGTEVKFGENSKYKAIEIKLNEEQMVELEGKIDRIDMAQLQDKKNKIDQKYVRIIDYKSSAKNIDLNDVYAGVQIQLLTYLDAVCKEENILPAGVLYFGLLEKILSTENRLSEEEVQNELKKEFKMKGLVLANEDVVNLHDKNLKSGSSDLVPAGFNKDGIITKSKTSGVNEEEFEILQKYIYVKIKELAKEILTGNIKINPINRSGKVPCEFCAYKVICKFNPNIYKYNYVVKKSKDEIIGKMKEIVNE